MKNLIINKVNKLISKYGTRDPRELADFLGVVIIEKPLGKVYGAYMYVKKTRIIFINDSISDSMKKIVLAHELGHSILHRKENCYFMKNKTLLVTNKFERQANLFAANLLIPDDLINNYPDCPLNQIAASEKIPIELLCLKFDLI